MAFHTQGMPSAYSERDPVRTLELLIQDNMIRRNLNHLGLDQHVLRSGSENSFLLELLVTLLLPSRNDGGSQGRDRPVGERCWVDEKDSVFREEVGVLSDFFGESMAGVAGCRLDR